MEKRIKVVDAIVKEVEASKYYSIIVDGIPDTSHIEQNVFILRYLNYDAAANKYTIEERFLSFEDCDNKTGNCRTYL